MSSCTKHSQDEFTQQKKEGVFCSQHPTQDILTQALETPEHCGRVRAVGGNITPTIYFNLTRGMSGVGKMQEMSKMMLQMNAKIIELENYIKLKDSEEKGSCLVKNNNDIQVIDDEVEIADVKAKAAQIVKVEGSKKTCRDTNLLSRIRFANPYETSFSPKVDVDQRAGKVGNRLIGTSTNQLVLVPCNVGFHWIMTVIDPHRETVYLLDSLSHQNHNEQWKHAVDMAIRIFNSSISKKGRKKPLWEIIKSPRQPDSKQCGFYIMRYMKDIVEACRSSEMISLHSLFAGGNYSRNELDEVRAEWAECLQDYVA
ncbi:hypothetical protein C2S52_007229 [Perilla frutescens var. hirtella]|nr:hypothetical protein C2S52_007229 [Perilla frutescens var. hirtella]